ncbi:MAG: VanZ family protein [Oscillospiraceae bacterium]|nr:VanZ family protein [Oscillospiraceae bacterium]
MIRSDKRLRLCKILLVCILAFIWGNSLLPGQVSGAFSDWVKSVLEGLLPAGPESQTSGGLLRKIAHFTEFTALGMTLGWLFGMLRKRPYWPVLLGVAAACMDETIQRFVPGRGPSVRDVVIDSSGVLTGLILLYLGHTYCKYRRNQSLERDR